MNIETLEKYLYEDLNGKILSVEGDRDASKLVIYFQCDDWKEVDVTRRFRIICDDVKEDNVRPCHSGEIEFCDTHPMLWKHNDDHGYLYYSSQADSRYELLGRLWEVHEKIFFGWRPLSEYINTHHAGQIIEFCKGSNGLLAQGPKTLLKAYKEASNGHIDTNYVPSYSPGGYYKALIFDNCFAICKSVNVEEVGID